MSRVFSFRDLIRVVPQFQGKSEYDLIRPEMDEAVHDVLADLGFSMRHAITYVPALHRDLTGRVAVGFMARGTLNHYARAYLSSPLCDPIELLIAAAKRDPSMAAELAKMLGGKHCLDDDYAIDKEPPYDGEVEPDYEDNLLMIQGLTQLRDFIRGNEMLDDGTMQTPK